MRCSQLFIYRNMRHPKTKKGWDSAIAKANKWHSDFLEKTERKANIGRAAIERGVFRRKMRFPSWFRQGQTKRQVSYSEFSQVSLKNEQGVMWAVFRLAIGGEFSVRCNYGKIGDVILTKHRLQIQKIEIEKTPEVFGYYWVVTFSRC